MTDACLDKWASQVQTTILRNQYGLVHLCRLQKCVAACVHHTRILPHWYRVRTHKQWQWKETSSENAMLRGWQARGSARLLLASFPSFVCREGGETCSFRNIGKYSAHCPLRLRYDNNNNARFPVYLPQLQRSAMIRGECSSTDEAFVFKNDKKENFILIYIKIYILIKYEAWLMIILINRL